MTVRAEQIRVQTRISRAEIERYVPPAILCGYGVFILSLLVRGVMTLYISPVYVWPTTAAGGILLALGLLGIIRARLAGHQATCSCDAGCDSCATTQASRLWPYLALCVPLLLAVLLPPQGLAAFSAMQRGPQVAGLSMIHGVGSVRRVSLSVDTGTFTLQDWAGALSADPNPKDYAGKQVAISGMVLKAAGIAPPGYLMLMRYQVTCCIADARPIGLIVRDTSGGAIKNGQWVKVTGVMGATSYQGSNIAVVEPKDMKTIKAGNPYMY